LEKYPLHSHQDREVAGYPHASERRFVEKLIFKDIKLNFR
jgi:hypothetical protein